MELVAKSNADVVLNRAAKAAENFGADLTKRLTSAFGAMALVDKGLSALQMGFDFVSNSLRKYGDIADQAQKSGMDGEDFQRLAYAAEQAGVAMNVVGKAARELRILMKDAANGNELARQKLIALGFTEEQIKNGTIKATDVFLQLANAMEQSGSDAEKLAILTAIFGDKVSTDILPLLDQTRAKLRETFGGVPVMDNARLQELDAMYDKLSKLKQILEFIAASGAFQAIFGRGRGGDLLPAAIGVFNPGAASSLIQSQIIANQITKDQGPQGADTGTPANAPALAALGTKIGEASLGSGVIGVGASPQVAAIEKSNEKLDSIDSKLGELVRAGIDNDFTKRVERHAKPFR